MTPPSMDRSAITQIVPSGVLTSAVTTGSSVRSWCRVIAMSSAVHMVNHTQVAHDMSIGAAGHRPDALEPRTLDQVQHRRTIPLTPPHGLHPTLVESVSSSMDACYAGGLDQVLEHGQHFLGMLIGTLYKPLPADLSSLPGLVAQLKAMGWYWLCRRIQIFGHPCKHSF